MRHRNSGRRLSMDTSERTAMFRNMVTSLMVHGQIRTTHARAKELRRFAERVITLGKRAPSTEGLEGEALQQAKAGRLHSLRQVQFWVHDESALAKVFGEYAERFATRPGGYTRVVKAGRRPGDKAPMAVVQLVESMSAAPAEESATAE